MILYLDTETTGLCPGSICQLSYITQTKDKTLAKNFFFTVDYIEPSAQAVHGFSVEKLNILSGGKRFGDCVEEIENDFALADTVVAHNVDFDMNFLRSEFSRLCKILPVKHTFCSMKKFTPILKILRSNGVDFKYPKLIELTKYFSISESDIKHASINLFGSDCGFHDARFDTVALFLAINKGFTDCCELDYLKDLL